MNAQSNKQRKKREKWRFILKVGVFGWGMSTAVIWTVLMQIFQPEGRWYMQLLIALFVFSLAGLIFGQWMWKRRTSHETPETDTHHP